MLDRKTPVQEAALRSSSEMAVPVLTATLTVVASFLPLLLLSGANGSSILTGWPSGGCGCRLPGRGPGSGPGGTPHKQPGSPLANA